MRRAVVIFKVHLTEQLKRILGVCWGACVHTFPSQAWYLIVCEAGGSDRDCLEMAAPFPCYPVICEESVNKNPFR